MLQKWKTINRQDFRTLVTSYINYRGPAEGWTPVIKCRRLLSFFQRYIVRDISLAHWNLIRHFEKLEAWRTVMLWSLTWDTDRQEKDCSFLEGREGVKWELGLTLLWTGKMGFTHWDWDLATGNGMNNYKMGMGFLFFSGLCSNILKEKNKIS